MEEEILLFQKALEKKHNIFFQESIGKNGTTYTPIDKSTGKKISNQNILEEINKGISHISALRSHNRLEENRKNKNSLTELDPTGISNWERAKLSFIDVLDQIKGDRDLNTGDNVQNALDMFSAVPIVPVLLSEAKGFKTMERFPTSSIVDKVVRGLPQTVARASLQNVGNEVASKVNAAFRSPQVVREVSPPTYNVKGSLNVQGSLTPQQVQSKVQDHGNLFKLEDGGEFLEEFSTTAQTEQLFNQSQGSAEPPSFSKFKKTGEVRHMDVHPDIKNYLLSLPADIQKEILVTATKNGSHSKHSTHYSGMGIDLNTSPKLFNYIKNDMKARQYGITLGNERDGKGKRSNENSHIHLSVGVPTKDTGKFNLFETKAGTDAYWEFLKKNNLNYLGTIHTPKNFGNNVATTNPVIVEGQPSTPPSVTTPTFVSTPNPYGGDIVSSEASTKSTYDGKRVGPYTPKTALEQTKFVQDQFDNMESIYNNLEYGDLAMEQVEKINGIRDAYMASKDQERKFIASQIAGNTLDMVKKSDLMKAKQSGKEEQRRTVENYGVPDLFADGGKLDLNSKIDILAGKLRKEGYNDKQIAGVIGSLMGEGSANLDTGTLNKRGSGAFGLAQWIGPRLETAKGLKAFAKNQGKDVTDFNVQTDFLIHELNTTHKHVANKLRKADSIYGAADIWTNDFEVPDKKGMDTTNRTRKEGAMKVYTQISGNEAPKEVDTYKYSSERAGERLGKASDQSAQHLLNELYSNPENFSQSVNVPPLAPPSHMTVDRGNMTYDMFSQVFATKPDPNANKPKELNLDLINKQTALDAQNKFLLEQDFQEKLRAREEEIKVLRQGSSTTVDVSSKLMEGGK